MSGNIGDLFASTNPQTKSTLECPECEKRFKLEDSASSTQTLSCPSCGTTRDISDFIPQETVEEMLKLARNKMFNVCNNVENN